MNDSELDRRKVKRIRRISLLIATLIIVVILVLTYIYFQEDKSVWYKGYENLENRPYTNNVTEILFPMNTTLDGVATEFISLFNLTSVKNMSYYNHTIEPIQEIFFYIHDDSVLKIILVNGTYSQLKWSNIPVNSPWQCSPDKSPLEASLEICKQINLNTSILNYEWINHDGKQRLFFEQQYLGLNLYSSSHYHYGNWIEITFSDSGDLIEAIEISEQYYNVNIKIYLTQYGAKATFKEYISTMKLRYNIQEYWILGLSIVDNKLCYLVIGQVDRPTHSMVIAENYAGYIDVQDASMVSFQGDILFRI